MSRMVSRTIRRDVGVRLVVTSPRRARDRWSPSSRRRPARGVLRQQRVQDRVADLVADLVRVALGHGLGGEQAAGTRFSLARRAGRGGRGRRPPPAGEPSREPRRQHADPKRVGIDDLDAVPAATALPRGTRGAVGGEQGPRSRRGRRCGRGQTSLTTCRSLPLRDNLARALVEDESSASSGLGGEAHDEGTSPGRRSLTSSAQDVGVADQPARPTAAPAESFLSLTAAHTTPAGSRPRPRS